MKVGFAAVPVCVALTCVTLVGGPSNTANQRQDTKYRAQSGKKVPNQYIVVFRDEVAADEESIAALADDLAAMHGGRRRHVYGRALKGFSVRMPEAAARRLSEDPRVAYVEEDGVTYGSDSQANPPNWGLDRVDQRARARDYTYEYRADGTGVNIYVVDSGVYLGHATFEGRAVGAYDAVGDGVGLSEDCNGHGTHVAGIAASSLYGVAKNAKVHSVRALGCNNVGTWADYVEALDWVATHHVKPAVLNASIGGVTVSSAIEAIARVTQAGVTFVGAAGNETVDACTRVPGAAPEAIVVGNSTDTDARATNSNYGTCVDIYAPGSLILSAGIADPDDAVYKWGTSMAAPHVAGAAALYLQGHPTATPAQVRQSLVASATAGVITDHISGDNLLLYTRYLGDTTPPSVALTSPAASSVLAGTASVAAIAVDDVEVSEVRFFAGNLMIGVDDTAPYGLAWSTASVPDGSYVLRATAVDLAGSTAQSTVSVTVNNGAGGTPPPVSGGTLPTDWTSGDVGAVGRAGAASYSAGTFSIQAGGTDVWGTADAFHFVHRAWTGDGELTARVANLPLPSGASFAMAGIMFRESLSKDARHAALLITTDGKLKFRRRTAVGGSTFSDGPSAGSATAPYWLKIRRAGNEFTAYRSLDGAAWTQTGPATTIALPATVRTGVWALRSGGTALTQATVTNVSVTAPGASLAAGWTNHDIGAGAPAGYATYASGVFTAYGSGADVWSTSDAFHFVHRPWSGDGDLVARLSSVVAPSGAAWAMAGIMLRESLAAGAKHATLLVSSDGKLKFRRRLLTNETTLSNGPSAGSTSGPQWLKLSRRGNVVSAYSSTDGATWTAVHVPETMSLAGTLEVGIWTLRNGTAGLAQAQFSNVTLVAAPAGSETITSSR